MFRFTLLQQEIRPLASNAGWFNVQSFVVMLFARSKLHYYANSVYYYPLTLFCLVHSSRLVNSYFCLQNSLRAFC